MIKTEKEINKLKEEVFKALTCLHLEVTPDSGIVEDVTGKVTALINALEINLVVAEKVNERIGKLAIALEKKLK